MSDSTRLPVSLSATASLTISTAGASLSLPRTTP